VIRQNQLQAGNGIVEFDPFSQPEPQAHEGADSPVQILQKVHRLLRGRYVLALILAFMGAAAGAAGGYFATIPKWRSVGAIRIQPTREIIVKKLVEDYHSDFDDYVNTHVNYLQEPRTIDDAMMSEEWRQIGRGLSKPAKREFRKALQVEVDRNSRGYIHVSFTDINPGAAQTAVQQVIAAWKKNFAFDDNFKSEDKIKLLLSKQRDLQGQIQALDDQVAGLAQRHGTSDLHSLEALQGEIVHRLALVESDLLSLDTQIAQTEVKPETPKPAAGNAPEKQVTDLNLQALALELAKTEPTLQRMIDDRDIVSRNLKAMQLRYPPTNPTVDRLQRELTSLNQEIEDRVKLLLSTRNGAVGPGDGGAAMGPIESVDLLKQRRDRLAKSRDEIKTKAADIDRTMHEIKTLQGGITKKNDELGEILDRLNDIKMESSKTSTDSNKIGLIEIVSEGDEAYLYSDARKKLAAAGFMLGGALPILGVMFLGAIDRRYRYSDDAGTAAGKIPLLGILPYLPEGLTDPDKAGVAAHCVHQIRTLLQLGGVDHNRKVFAITSSTSGDGKTSLCLSLGLSFAASGSNTLLIDFDMIGGGLTAAMGARSDVGLLAAIDDGQLEGHARPTAFPRLSLIPSGRDDAQEISRLSPKHVRRLIDQARKEFDVVVIDTGPVLGSIEATLVCGIADGVVLALGRGQQRTMATRAIETLRSIGAHIMGVVFNRAQPNDFKRAVSQSVRSVPAQDTSSITTLKALPSLGPMARTVASHIRPDA
jgi:capsular exopolysaccharide synthesis family protein